MTASIQDVGAALAEMDRLLETARGGHIGAATLVDRLHTQQRAIAAAAAVVAGDGFSIALLEFEAGGGAEGALGRLTDEFALYRQAVHEAIEGMSMQSDVQLATKP